MIVTCRQMQQCEEAAFARGVTAAALMEEAGCGIAEVVRQFAPEPGSLVLFLGKGNNAGDALVAARELAADGWRLYVRLSCKADEMKELPRRHFAVLGESVEVVDDVLAHEFPTGPLVCLDGLLGIGAQGPMKEDLQVLAREMNALHRQRHALTVAMDIPSGLNGEACEDAVEADVTAVVAQVKAGLVEDGADRYVGRIAFVPLPELAACEGDSEAEVLTARLLRPFLPRRPNDMHKGDVGRVGVLAGSRGFLGAAELACLGALRAGAGLVTLLVKKDAYPLIATCVPAEVMVKLIDDYRDVLEMRFDALAIGPGLGFDDEKEVLEVMKEWKLPAVIDADALTMLAENPEVLDQTSELPRLMTPHPGELDRLLRSFPGWHGMSRRKVVEALVATAPGRTLLLKGARTVIATRGEPTWFNSTGHPGMASGGMGDVLTGVCAAFAAQKVPLQHAAGLSAWLCGRAAEVAAIGDVGAIESVCASDVAKFLGAALLDLKQGCF
ncbi:MAG: NAD(P)H-hydrate dehydratase [Prosthecobacter sp.]